MIGRCRNCRYWKNGERGNMTCGCNKFEYGYHTRIVPVDAALIESDEGWGWFVGPDFGCVHFEAEGTGE